MTRAVAAHFEARVSGRCRIIFSIAPATGIPIRTEQLSCTVDGRPVDVVETADRHGGRLHELIVEESTVVLDYHAEGIGTAAPSPAEPTDLITYLRPSRYAESDILGPTSWGEFAGLRGAVLLDAVTEWVHDRLDYVAMSSRGIDGAVDTLLARQGVCRDFAHLTIALLRAANVPARLVSCYAPGLSPMEYHAVVEAWVDDTWVVLDPTRKAPRGSLVRIATGRDAADTAFITNHWARLDLAAYQVTATADPLPVDDHRSRMVLH